MIGGNNHNSGEKKAASSWGKSGEKKAKSLWGKSGEKKAASLWGKSGEKKAASSWGKSGDPKRVASGYFYCKREFACGFDWSIVLDLRGVLNVC